MGQRSEGYWKDYYAEHREQRIAESVAYQQANREQRRAYAREWAANNREHIREYRAATADKRNARRRERYASDVEHREQKRRETREWQRANPEKRLAQRLKRYGITPEQYHALLDSQGGGCAICGQAIGDERGGRLHVDHCHDEGHVRGILCGNCNLGIGKFADDPDRLERAALYLRSCQRSQAADH